MKKVITLILLSTLIFAQEQILIDESFDDWNKVANYYEDALGDNLNGDFDFKSFWVTNDEEYLYFRIQTSEHILLVNKNFLTIYIDADNNLNTGKNINGFGAELEYTFGTRSGKIYSNGESVIYNRDIGFIGSPTFSGNEFEFVIKIDSTNKGLSLSPNDTIKIKFIAYTSSQFTNYFDLTPDIGGYEYTIKNSNIKNTPTNSIEKEGSNYIRVMSYNVARDGITSVEKTNEFDRIFKAIRPEIIGLTEAYQSTSQQIADRIEFFLPSLNDQTWYNKKEGEYDIVLVSRYKIKKSATIHSEVGHDASGAFLLDLRPNVDSDILVIVSHPKCCSGTEEDNKRQNQFDAMISFIRNSIDSTGEFTVLPNTPIVIMGDMNLVGDSRQYETLITGDIKYNEVYGEDLRPDWDSSGFDDAIPFVINTGMTYTTNPGSFPPGRLDFVVYSGSVMEPVKSFVFDTDKLTGDQLSQYGLSSADTKVSDHLPIVIDFNLTPITTVKKKDNSLETIRLNQNFPNPFNSTTSITYSILNDSNIKLSIYDVIGNEVAVLVNGNKSLGSYSQIFDASELASGIYFYRLKVFNQGFSGDYISNKKMILLK